MTTNYIKMPQNIPTGRKIFQMAKNIPKCSIPRPFKIYRNALGFLELKYTT
jgi:hypothetical protein